MAVKRGGDQKSADDKKNRNARKIVEVVPDTQKPSAEFDVKFISDMDESHLAGGKQPQQIKVIVVRVEATGGRCGCHVPNRQAEISPTC